MGVDAKLRVAVVGATGYAGAELVRLLCSHPEVSITFASSERDAGKALAEVHSYLAPAGLELQRADVGAIASAADVAFVALPHGTSAPIVEGLLDRGLRVVDLGADFRFRDQGLYESWYGSHPAPSLLSEAVYGLTEFARDSVASARLVANPGCYPTGALFALLPLAAALEGDVLVDSKSGTSGAGRGAATDQLYAEVADNVRPYKAWSHRHQPEMQATLAAAAGAELPVLFVPHLVPMARGLLSNVYVRVADGTDVAGLFDAAYADEPFVRVLPEGQAPQPRNVRGTNMVEIGWTRDPRSNRVAVISAIDNLGKGAAGQAVQNLNRMLGWAETTGLSALPALP